MKKYILILLLSVVTGWGGAQNLISVTSGKAIEAEQHSGVDHVFIFSDLTNAEISSEADATWYKFAEGVRTEFQSGTNYLYPEDNTGYIAVIGSGEDMVEVSFWVIDYSKHRLDIRSMEVVPDPETRCERTRLRLDADLPELTYQTVDGRHRTLDRTCTITYTSLSWNGEQWQDSLCVDNLSVHREMSVGAPLRNTFFTIGADQFAAQLGIEVDSVATNEVYEAVAVACHPTTVTTIRGDESENQHTNEVERPAEVTQLQGSAPLEILFRANANAPVAQYYQWRIYKGSQLIVQRTDEQHRYVFDQYGEYRVVLVVSNDFCEADSVTIDVSVSLSQLLVPNVFTPNGDGRNDEFRVTYRSIIEFECWIYNRWGHLVYHWTDPAKGWDGTINGRPAAEGAYFYVIRAKGADAEAGGKYHRATTRNPATIGIYQLSGDINLIRGNRK